MLDIHKSIVYNKGVISNEEKNEYKGVKAMINNYDHVVGFYTDMWGNEIDEYEQVYKYTVWYKGYIFVDDKEDDFNEHGYDRWDDVQELIDAYGDMIHVIDNEYCVSFDNGEWS